MKKIKICYKKTFNEYLLNTDYAIIMIEASWEQTYFSIKIGGWNLNCRTSPALGISPQKNVSPM